MCVLSLSLSLSFHVKCEKSRRKFLQKKVKLMAALALASQAVVIKNVFFSETLLNAHQKNVSLRNKIAIKVYFVTQTASLVMNCLVVSIFVVSQKGK
jgi:hypothetical protein